MSKEKEILYIAEKCKNCPNSCKVESAIKDVIVYCKKDNIKKSK